MNKNFLWFLFITIVSCDQHSDKPTLDDLEYQFQENQYTLDGDSIVRSKSSKKLYHLDLERDSNSLIARWTEKLPVFTSDSSDLERMLYPDYRDGFSAEFRLLESGEIDSLINWNALKDYVDSITVEYYTYEDFSLTEIEKIKPYLEVKQSKHRLINNGFKGIFAYHNFFGIEVSSVDSLQSPWYFDLNGERFESSATVRIDRSRVDFIDYLVALDYDGSMDLELVSELKNLMDSDISELNSVNLNDTVFYRYNKRLERLDNVFYKRYLTFETFQAIQEIELSSR